MEEEPEGGQHISAIVPVQQSMQEPDAAAASGAWNAARSARSRKAAVSFIATR